MNSPRIEQTSDGFAIMIDNKPWCTPQAKRIVVPHRDLAHLLAEEQRYFQYQKKAALAIDSDRLAFSKLVNTALDKVAANQAQYCKAVVKIAADDLLCHRVVSPKELAAHQQRLWDPPLDLLKKAYGVKLTTTTDLAPITQSPDDLQIITNLVCSYNMLQLAGVHAMALLSGSTVLALGLTDAVITNDQAWRALSLEERWNQKLWGKDEQAQIISDRFKKQFNATAIFIRLVVN